MIERYEKAGYLKEPFRLFHLNDGTSHEFNLHYHDFDKIILFFGGNVSYLIEGKNYYLEPGDIVLVNRFHLHKPTVDPKTPYDRAVLYISHEFLKKYRSEGYDPFRMFHLASDRKDYVLRLPEHVKRRLMGCYERLEAAVSEEGYGAEERRRLLFLEFMTELNRLPDAFEEDEEPIAGAVFHQKNIDILSYLNEHLTEEITVDELAERFYVSKYHMMRQFKAETGYSIHKYVTEKRLIMAKRLLLKDNPIVKVSELCGFSEYSVFLRAFRKRFGVTPGDFVKEKRGIF